MPARLLPLDSDHPDPQILADAGAWLRRGEVVAFPTETVYGLGADALNAEAVAKIFAVKGRPSTNPIIVHVAEERDVLRVAECWPESAEKLAAAFWPGPLTLVLPKRDCVPGIVTAGGPTVAVRCPAHAGARALIRAAGVPLAAPSANRSNELSPSRAEHVVKSLGDRIPLILDGGPCRGGIESTVVDLGDGIRILRPGLISAEELERVVGPLQMRALPAGPARSPGQLSKHYSPRTPLVLVRDHNIKLLPGDHLLDGMPATPGDYAAELYARLHDLDALGFRRIVAILPPDTPAWAGVRDRLLRAASEVLFP
jgi:L-threonylcarbamoyladenylate synthase